MADKTMYTVGGTVQAGTGVYIPRKADEDLLALCRESKFTYILTPRQMGKSSLMMRTAERLRQQGVAAVTIDLSLMGSNLSAEEWYLGILTIIGDKLDLETDAINWWQQQQHMGITQRLTLYFQTVLLREFEKQVVIFIDEIDTTLGLPFTDDFFIAIRYLYNARAANPEFKRLSFVLIGVATPGDLIADPQRTPFNIGQRVDLTDFTAEEALPFARGLGLPPEKAQPVLSRILEWTGGHPYLTQRLCAAIASQAGDDWSEDRIAGAVHSTFFDQTSELDNNLQFVRDMLTRRAPKGTEREVLLTYQQIYRDKTPVKDEEQSLAKNHLKLSGIVKRQNQFLLLRNPIYREVFNAQWIKEHLPTNWVRRLRRLLVALGTSLVIIIILILITSWALESKSEAVRQQGIAEEAKNDAIQARDLAEDSSRVAMEQRAIALEEQAKAIDAAEEAQKQRRIAEQRRREVLRQKAIADSNVVLANAARDSVKQQYYHANYLLAKLLEEKAATALQDAIKTHRNSDYQRTWQYTLAALNQDVRPGQRQAISPAKLLSPDMQSRAFPERWCSTRRYPKAHSVAFSPDGKRLASGS
ncbi:AAA-like domain-containing protein, partial [candidate division KSB1 bacterium]|nr:AAA-like domain-containing protein [candidate division KSB1 bacterium]